jgi:DNA-directed RNA polymerase subunit RPC12/RpoP
LLCLYTVMGFGMPVIDHACIDCGKVRKVRTDKLDRGIALRCRICNAKHTAKAKSEAMKRYAAEYEGIHGKKSQCRSNIYGICKVCSKDYEKRPIEDDGYCSHACRDAVEINGFEPINRFNRLKKCFLFGLPIASARTEQTAPR